jgi:hypothetical protein
VGGTQDLALAVLCHCAIPSVLLLLFCFSDGVSCFFVPLGFRLRSSYLHLLNSCGLKARVTTPGLIFKNVNLMSEERKRNEDREEVDQKVQNL